MIGRKNLFFQGKATPELLLIALDQLARRLHRWD
jgi:hypothetical protein